MKRTYNFNYENGKYYFKYTRPGSEKMLTIDEENMELDTQQLYHAFFEEINDDTEININNIMNSKEVPKEAIKKGEYIMNTVRELCDEILGEMKKECF